MADLPVVAAGHGKDDALPPGHYAVFGGSFNPPHIAHVMVALWILETQAVDGILVVPCYLHPFDKALAPFEDRLEMCRLALAPLAPRVRLSTIERDLDRGDGTPSRTLDTLEALAARNPEARFRLVIGADILPERGKWWRWDEVERLAPPLVTGRQGYAVPEELGPVVDMPGVSSTEVRERLAAGATASHLLPRSVHEYIMRRGLYRT